MDYPELPKPKPVEQLSEEEKDTVVTYSAMPAYRLWRFSMYIERHVARETAIYAAEDGAITSGYEYALLLNAQVTKEDLYRITNRVCAGDMWDPVPHMESWVVSRLAEGAERAGQPTPLKELVEADRYCPRYSSAKAAAA